MSEIGHWSPAKMQEWILRQVIPLAKFKNQVTEKNIASLVPEWTLVSAGQFQNGWTNFDSIRKARYYKDASGIVRLSGVVKDGTASTPIFTLPEGYWPDYNVGADYAWPAHSNTGYSPVIVSGAGVVHSPTGGVGAWVFLNSISFRAK